MSSPSSSTTPARLDLTALNLAAPRTAFHFFFDSVRDDLFFECLQDESARRVPDDGKLDPRNLTLPSGFATVVDGLGELIPVAEETAKKCRAYLEYRKVPRHKIPKVGMRADGMVALRNAAARQAAMERAEQALLATPSEVTVLERKMRDRALTAWRDAVAFGADVKAAMDAEEAHDVKRYHDNMRTYYTAVACGCQQRAVCDGGLCICKCWFCATDRKHAIAGKRCKCCKHRREATRWSGATLPPPAGAWLEGEQGDNGAAAAPSAMQMMTKSSKKKPREKSQQEKATAQREKEEAAAKERRLAEQVAGYRPAPSRTCPCETSRACAVMGCDCFCGFCVRQKARLVKENAATNSLYCPCYQRPTCRGATECACACYKCSLEKELMGYCPFQPPIGIRK